jgi:serine/threonine protein phosphatase PrpC
MTAKDLPSRVVVGAASDTGRIRAQNEDAFHVDPERGLFIVADGMGGHQAGDVASKAVVSILPMMVAARLKKLKGPRSLAIRYWLKNDILKLSQQLHAEAAKQAGVRGMGATLVMALLRGDRAHIAHMGDSRVYLFRENHLSQLTEDHSIMALLLRGGEITAEEAKTHPARNQITRFVGMGDPVYPDVRTFPLKAGDRLLLCSDGLTGMVSDKDIATILRATPVPQQACDLLVQAANEAGGKDNITVVVVEY